jgi:glycolate oxidase FAD binding subunit
MATAERIRVESPTSAQVAADLLRGAGASRLRVRPRGGGTKLGWGRPAAADIELRTGALDAIVAHDAADLTAVLGAGVPLASAQVAFAAAGQRLALDPPDPGGATIGGIVATGDSGPLRHRFGAARDLVLGVAVALSDGTVAHAGGRVIKNVAGYDLGKLLAGSFGTLGVVVEVALRLHPLPADPVTLRAAAPDAGALTRAGAALAAAALQPEALDLAWADGAGAVLVRFAGAAADAQAQEAVAVLAGAGLEAEEVDDAGVWAAQRDGQRAVPGGAVVRVSGRPSALLDVLDAAQAQGASVVARVGLGLSWVRLPAAEPEALVAAIERLRVALAPAPCVVLDAPAEVRGALDPWDEPAEGARAGLMRRVKARFDPAGACNPGRYAAGI